MNNICVLMSTFNGELFIKEQIESLLLQKDVNLSIIIRDDGSSDKTVSIIKEFVQKNNNILLYEGENLGPSKSFLKLLEIAPYSDYYAFCDQDDVWKSDKLINALIMIKAEEKDGIPVMYHSSLTLTDSNLNVLSTVKVKKHSRYVPLVDNTAVGCTIVFNDVLRRILVSRIPDTVSMHDAWCNIVCSLFGKVVTDKNSYIYYRQHDNNTIGIKTEKNVLKYIRIHLKRLHNTSFQPRLSNAQSLWNCFYKELNESDKVKIERILMYKNNIFRRLLLLLDFSIHSYSISKDLKYRFLIILGEI